MSAAHRSLVRLPLDIFADLIRGRGDNKDSDNPTALRRAICNKLKKFPSRSRSRANGDVIHESVTTVGQLLTRISKLTLLKVLDPLLTYEECHLFLHRVACTCAPQPQSALELLQVTESITDLTLEAGQTNPQHEAAGEHPWNRMRFLPTGVASLDQCLRGGLRIGTITELVGRAGAGKTQLAMQLCVMAARYRQGCIYIDTEKKLSLPRLQEIAEKRATDCYNQTRASSGMNRHGDNSNNHGTAFSYGHHSHSFSFASSVNPPNQRQHGNQHGIPMSSSSSADNIPYRHSKEVLDNVTIMSPTTTQELLSALVEVEELILVHNQDAMDAERSTMMASPHHHHPANGQSATAGIFPIRLLILDSIAAPTKRGFGCESAPERAGILFQCAQTLKQLADQLQLAVLVINQVFLEQQQQRRNDTMMEHPTDRSEVLVKAALGNSWHHCVSTRIMLEPQQEQPKGHHHLRDCGHSSPAPSHRNTRTARIIKSNLVGLQCADYEVVGSGVVDAETGSLERRDGGSQHDY